MASNMAWIVSLVTLISTILFSVYFKGFLGQLPLILGPVCGCLAAFIIKLTTGIDLFKVLPVGTNTDIFAPPIFTLPKPTWNAVVAIMPIAIATIPDPLHISISSTFMLMTLQKERK